MTGHRLLFLATSIVHLFADPLAAGAAPAGIDALAAQYMAFQATVEAVIEQGSIEGYPVAVARFASQLPVDDALAFTVGAWRRHGAPPLVTRAGIWQVVSQHEAGRYRTLQIRRTSNGGSEGLISFWSNLSPGAASPISERDPARFLPAGARVLRSLGGVDAGRTHKTLVAVSDGSASWVVQALELRMATQGFTRDPVLHANTGGGASGQARLYRRPGAEVAVTVHAHQGRSAIVIHFTETIQ